MARGNKTKKVYPDCCCHIYDLLLHVWNSVDSEFRGTSVSQNLLTNTIEQSPPWEVVQDSPPFMEWKVHKEPATGPYPEPDESISLAPYRLIYSKILKRYIPYSKTVRDKILVSLRSQFLWVHFRSSECLTTWKEKLFQAQWSDYILSFAATDLYVP
jgi:hypothetical protein